MTEALIGGKEHIASLRPTIDQLRSIGERWADLLYALEKYAAAYDLLLSRYAKFQVGARVQLRATPRIDEMHSPGWLGSKHFLVVGARGMVREADVRNGAFYYQVVFDFESWIDSKGVEHVIEVDKRASYCFREDELADALHCSPPSQA
jgi:hypothetical protein